MDPVKLRAKRAKAGIVSPVVSPIVVPLPSKPIVALSPAQIQAQAQAPQQPGEPPTNEREREGKVLEQLFTQALRRTEALKPAEDTGMKLIQAISHSISNAEPVGKLDALMLPHLGEMASKAHLMLMALNYHNIVERVSLYSMARWTLEKGLWNDLIQGAMSPVEKLALLQLTIKEMDKAQVLATDYKETMESGGRGTTADVQATSEKMDRAVKKEDLAAVKELEGTTPVGREVVRRMLDKANTALQRMVQASNATAPEPPKQ